MAFCILFLYVFDCFGVAFARITSTICNDVQEFSRVGVTFARIIYSVLQYCFLFCVRHDKAWLASKDAKQD